MHSCAWILIDRSIRSQSDTPSNLSHACCTRDGFEDGNMQTTSTQTRMIIHRERTSPRAKQNVLLLIAMVATMRARWRGAHPYALLLLRPQHRPGSCTRGCCRCLTPCVATTHHHHGRSRVRGSVCTQCSRIAKDSIGHCRSLCFRYECANPSRRKTTRGLCRGTPTSWPHRHGCAAPHKRARRLPPCCGSICCSWP